MLKQLLGNAQYIKPTTAHEAWVMLKGTTDFLQELGDGIYIASTGYALAATLMLKHGWYITCLMLDEDKPHFLMQLLHQIDWECHFLFQEFFDDIKATGSLPYRVNERRIDKCDSEIEDMFCIVLQ